MHPSGFHRYRRLLTAVVLLAASGSLRAAPPATQPASGGLRAELLPRRPIFNPFEPIRIRFVLVNETDEPLELDCPAAALDDGPITLPRSLVLGSASEPALWVSYDEEKPVAADAPTAPAETAGRLRLGPRASVGVELDLRSVFSRSRYSGTYHVEWRVPCTDGRLRASATFRVESRKMVVIVTDYGKMSFDLFYDRAPRNVANFIELAERKFYDGLTFHRIVPGYLIQGGSPDGSETGTRPDGKTVPAEFSDLPFTAGTLAMARKPSDPDSASCQFFITLARIPELDGKYTIIGQAHDETTLRTLRHLAELPTDGQYRPLRPVVIRFLTLVDADQLQFQRVEITPP